MDQRPIRFAASKVAALCGLHEFTDVYEDLLEHIYQDLPELLLADAKLLNLKIVSKEDELVSLIQKTGLESSKELKNILTWTKETKEITTNSKAIQLVETVANLVSTAKKNRCINEEEAKEIKKVIREQINKSVGSRNEHLAIQKYEAKTGQKVFGNNEQLYSIEFPRKEKQENVETPSTKKRKLDNTLFYICGMIDGMTEIFKINKDDEWEMEMIVVEVKNRMSSFRDPPPLYDQVQMAVYMKLLNCSQGDLIQCMNDDQSQIKISRINLHQKPLQLNQAWDDIIVPRLNQYAEMIETFRLKDHLRLAFLNGTDNERRDIILRYCPFLEHV